MLTSFPGKKKKRAFTLVEIMITLTIIGVVGGLVARWFVLNRQYQKRLTELSDGEDNLRKITWTLHQDLKTARTILYPRRQDGSEGIISDTRLVIRNFDGDLVSYFFKSDSKELVRVTSYIPTGDAKEQKDETIGNKLDSVVFTNRNNLNNLVGFYLESGPAMTLDSVFMMNE